MKKILYNILLAIFIFFPYSVLAEGNISVSPSSLTIEEGSSKTFTITAYNAIGDVSIKSNDSAIASVSTNEWETGMVEEKQTKKGAITVTGKSIGSTTITLKIDAATFDSEDLSGQTKTITVNVIAKQEPKPNPEDKLSKNNNLKTLTIEGYNLVKVNNNNYTLTVLNNVESIKINATAEDSKAKISGTGSHKLNIGENKIEVIVTSESGEKNKINIKITRKDGYYLEDLETALKNDEINEIDIIINGDSKITKDHISKIKDSQKIVRLNNYDENKKIVYTWLINGKEINDSKEFSTKITFKTENEKEIYKLSNYADGLYVNFEHNGDLPTNTKIKLYVGNKFEEGNSINIYHYNHENKTLDFVKQNTVKDGYLELDLEHCSEYFITMSTIGSIIKQKDTSLNIFAILTIISLVVIFGLVIFIFFKLRLNKKNGAKNNKKTDIAEINNQIIDNLNQENVISSIDTSNANSEVQNIDNITIEDIFPTTSNCNTNNIVQSINNVPINNINVTPNNLNQENVIPSIDNSNTNNQIQNINNITVDSIFPTTSNSNINDNTN